tara:strand:+ start:112 stop:225 length:114 start_codon:yes stop_codon:yes gene_type:complete
MALKGHWVPLNSNLDLEKRVNSEKRVVLDKDFSLKTQ